jgi:hypothetical protein
MRFLLILITVLALLIIADGGVMRTSLCQVTPFELSQVNLCGADLRAANLYGADLQGVNLQQAQYDRRTQWPEGFTPPEEAIFVE